MGYATGFDTWLLNVRTVMLKENTETESEGFPLKREVREKCKRLIRLLSDVRVLFQSEIRTSKISDESRLSKLKRALQRNLFKSQEETIRLHVT